MPKSNKKIELTPEEEAFRRGIRAAADFAGTWDNYITGTPYYFEDVILGKFNLLPKSKMRKKKVPRERKG